MSTLSQELDRYLTVRRGLGFELCTDERILRRFIEYAQRVGAEYVNAEIFIGWRGSFGDASQYTWSRRLGIIRIFAHWLHGIDPRHEVPSRDLIPSRQRRNKPYIYSPAEIRAIPGASAEPAARPEGDAHLLPVEAMELFERPVRQAQNALSSRRREPRCHQRS